MRTAAFWLILLAACSSAESAESPDDNGQSVHQPGDVIDSIFPMETYVARFRLGTEQVDRLSDGAASADALGRAVLKAVSSNDIAALNKLVVTRSEFAWLVFPEHLYSRPPYDLDPAILWMQLQAESAKGATRLLKELGHEQLKFRSMHCQQDTTTISSNQATLLSRCIVDYSAADSIEQRQLFGSIYQRGGVFKLMGLANDF